MHHSLKTEILKTLTFFDLFHFPLTPLEVWQFLGVKCRYRDVLAVIDDVKGLESQSGFVFLAGRGGLVQTRLSRYNHAHRKFKRALKVARFFALIPWVELVAIGNQLGSGNARHHSDIDFFIVSQARRIWLTRFFATGAMKLLNLRPRPQRKKDTICLSFYVTVKGLELSCSRLDENDIYFRYWLANLMPIFDRADNYQALIKANDWLSQELPNWQAKQMNWPRQLDSFSLKGYNVIMDLLLGWLEGAARLFEKAIMPAALKENMNKNTNCLVNDNMLKLYVNDRRGEIRERYRLKICNL